MDATLEVNERQVSERAPLSAFSGLLALFILVAVLLASTYIRLGEDAQAPSLTKIPPGASQGDPAPVPGVTFYLLDSDAQGDEIRKVLDLASDQVAHTPLQAYPRVVTLFAHTPGEEALANAGIVAEVLSSKGEPRRIEVIDLRAQTLK
jgi:hypothetical protein